MLSILGLILIFGIWQVNSFFGLNKTKDIVSNPIIEQKQIEIPPYEVQGSATNVIIKNNLDKQISLSVTYRIYSKWFGIDSQQTKVFDVEANSQQLFDVWNNQGCLTAPCSVIIVSSKEI